MAKSLSFHDLVNLASGRKTLSCHKTASCYQSLVFLLSYACWSDYGDCKLSPKYADFSYSKHLSFSCVSLIWHYIILWDIRILRCKCYIIILVFSSLLNYFHFSSATASAVMYLWCYCAILFNDRDATVRSCAILCNYNGVTVRSCALTGESCVMTTVHGTFTSCTLSKHIHMHISAEFVFSARTCLGRG